MKESNLLITTMAALFSFGGFAQGSQRIADLSTNQLIADASPDNGLAIVSYHVVEKTNMAFGSTETTYDVSSLSMIPTAPLAANNVRTITPRYAKAKPKAVLTTSVPTTTANAMNTSAPAPAITAATPIKTTVPEVKTTVVSTPVDKTATMAPPTLPVNTKPADKVYAGVDIAGTYERILDKGYQSVEMLKKVANAHYFDGDLVAAAKWYGQLFEQTPILDALYYYRYAQALKAIDQPVKAGEMLKLFEKYKDL